MTARRYYDFDRVGSLTACDCRSAATGRWWSLPLSAHLLCVAVVDATLDPGLFRPEILLYPSKKKKSHATPSGDQADFAHFSERTGNAPTCGEANETHKKAHCRRRAASILIGHLQRGDDRGGAGESRQAGAPRAAGQLLFSIWSAFGQHLVSCLAAKPGLRNDRTLQHGSMLM